MDINIKTKIKDIWSIPEIAPAAPFFIGGSKDWYEQLEKLSFEEVHNVSPTWNAEDMAFGVKRLVEIATEKKQYLYDVFPDSETADDVRKKNVKLFHFPGKSDKPFVIVCAGGAFGAVASLAEAFPVAARLNELGYTAFCLNYRTGDMAEKYFEIVPKALDDFAAALRFINKNSHKLSINNSHYGVCGFSAGGHLCSQWANPKTGYKIKGCAKPDVLFLGYGVISKMQFKKIKQKIMWSFISKVMYGENYTKETLTLHNIIENADNEYPPTYILQSKDDPVVPSIGAEKLSETLTKIGVPCKIELTNTGGHGFGLGTGTDAEGWLDRAVEFWENLK